MSENTTPQGSESLNVNQAADAFLGMLGSDEGAVEGQPEELTEDQEEVESEVETELVDSEEAEPEQERTFKVKAAGEEREVTLEQLIEGYQLGQDYTKKTQKLSEDKRVVEAERSKIEEANKLRDQYAHRLQMMEQFLRQQSAGEDIEALKEVDPIGYAVKVAEQAQKEKQLAVLQQEQQRIAQQQQAERQEHLQRHLADEAQKLSAAIPEYANPKTGDQIRKDIRDYAKSIGWTEQELGGLYDSRAVFSLYHGMKYAKLQGNKPSITKKVEAVPKMMKSGTSQPRNSEAEQRKNTMAQLRKTGTVRDAANAFERFL